MKNIVFSKLKTAMFVVVVSVFLPLSSLLASRVCLVSSNPDDNGGFCREIAGGGGDACYVNGTGTACSGNGVSVDV